MADLLQNLGADIRRLLNRHGVGPKQKVWLAVSGGLDSMALLHAARCVDGDFGVLHVDHGLRADSADDAAFVRNEAVAMGWPCHTHTIEGLADSEARRNWGLEAAARQARYGWMAEMVGAEGVVLTAHHADDQRETQLLHWLRGSQPDALAGMLDWHQAHGFFLGRPFLGRGKADLRAALEAAGHGWREDATNVDPAYLRNRIRHDLIPLLDEMRPGWAAGMTRTGEIAKEWRKHLSGWMAGVQERPCALSLEAIRHAPSPTQLMGLWSAPFGFGPAQSSVLLELALETTEVGRSRASSTHRIVRERAELVAVAVGTDAFKEPVHWTPGEFSEFGELKTEEGRLTWRMETRPVGVRIDPADDTAQLDWSRVKPPLCLRAWREGDRIQPLGLEGSQLISDVLTQRKVAATERAGQWVVEQADGRIVWLVGHRIARHAALSTGGEEKDADPQKAVLHLEWKPVG
ncbi:MAG: tRNA lysidine(34) synthetase TilS [Flavobacteriales bacterium]|nr:tRNA lysidine(34) synthetase TilS [Flavobacteriales bacterium]